MSKINNIKGMPIAEYHRQYYEDNKEKSKQYREDNKETIAERNKQKQLISKKRNELQKEMSPEELLSEIGYYNKDGKQNSQK